MHAPLGGEQEADGKELLEMTPPPRNCNILGRDGGANCDILGRDGGANNMTNGVILERDGGANNRANCD